MQQIKNVWHYVFIFLFQIEDMHNEMEHATGYLKNRLAEQQNMSELTKMQVRLNDEYKEWISSARVFPFSS